LIPRDAEDDDDDVNGDEIFGFRGQRVRHPQWASHYFLSLAHYHFVSPALHCSSVLPSLPPTTTFPLALRRSLVYSLTCLLDEKVHS
jgi:hypothetical protein